MYAVGKKCVTLLKRTTFTLTVQFTFIYI